MEDADVGDAAHAMFGSAGLLIKLDAELGGITAPGVVSHLRMSKVG